MAAVQRADDTDESLNVTSAASTTTATRAAQEVLDAAVESVNSLLNTMRLSREISRAVRSLQPQGRLSHAEVDLLRSALVLAGAGLDAALKELIRENLEGAILADSKAREKFEEFTESYLSDSGAVARMFSSPVDARELLIDQYTGDLVGSSLQSVEQIEMVCTALGLTSAEFRKELAANETLRAMFEARNRIIHEFDITPDEYHKRRYHTIENAKQLARAALLTAQRVIDEITITIVMIDSGS